MLIDIHEIKRRLPHREPILMVSHVKKWVSFDEITTSHQFKPDDQLWKFIQMSPTFRPLLAVEAIAQSSALLYNLSADSLEEKTLFLLLGLHDVSVEDMKPEGYDMEVQARKVSQKGNIYKIKGTVHIGGKLFVTASILGLASKEND